jgi:hypothetical protein
VKSRGLLLAQTRSVARATRFAPSLVCALLGLAVVAAPALLGEEFGYLDVALTLRCGMFVTVLGAAFVLDDPAARTTEVLPFSPARVAGLRMGLALLVVISAWGAQLALAPLITAPGQSVPVAGLTLEPLALALLTLSCAGAAAQRRKEGTGGVLAAPFLALLTVVLMLLPPRWALFAEPFTEQFGVTRRWWAGLLCAGVVACAAGVRQGTARRGT